MSDAFRRIPAALLRRSTVEAARALLGAVVVSVTSEGRTAGRIVEAEAYCGPDDPASHSAIYHRTAKVRVMAGPVGIAYVYRSYGVHAMLNVAAHADGGVGAVLVRALEPLEGLDLMRRRRGVARDRDLCSGPGKLCQALGITIAHSELPLDKPPIQLFARKQKPEIAIGVRIGITKAVELPWRYGLKDSQFLSKRF